MTTRDRLVVIGLSTLAVLAAVWLLLVSPEREKAAKLATQVSAASTQLASAQGGVTDARGAQARYASAYASIVSLGKAVPPGEEVPSLIYQLAQASNEKSVEFNSIATGSAGTTSTSSPTTAPAAAIAGFTKMPFTFVFKGDFSDLYRLFQSLNQAAVRTSSGGLRVSGRLLTIQGVKLAPSLSEAGKSSTQLVGTITATAYVLPAGQALTGGASSGSPASTGAASSSSTAAASSSSTAAASSSPAPAAIVGASR
jgi:hypothetical protein